MILPSLLYLFLHVLDGSTTGNTKASSVQNLPQNADEVIYHLERISYNDSEEDVIGNGSFKTIVYKGKFDGRDVAVKKVHRNVFSISEKKLLIKCDKNKNIIHYYCIEQDSICYYLAFELCLCTIDQYIENKEKYQQTLSRNISDCQIIKDIIKGLKFLHENNIIHRDIRPSNILLADRCPKRLNAVISDFGISRLLSDGRYDITTSGRKGARGWIAPEMYEKEIRLRPAMDIFSLGCIIYYLLTNGGHPFDLNETKIITSQHDLSHLKQLPGNAVSREKSLVKQMIQYEYTKRPNINQISDIWNRLVRNEPVHIQDSSEEENQLEEKSRELKLPQKSKHYNQRMFQEREFKNQQHQVSELQKQVFEKDSQIARLLRNKSSGTMEPAQQENSHNTKSSIAHDIVQFTLDDVSKLMVILQPVEDDWYQLGHHLDMEASTLSDEKESPIQMENLLQRWCREGESTLRKLEDALIAIGRKDLVSGLHEMKSVTKINISVQFNYLTTLTDMLDGLNNEHIAGKKLFLIQGDGPQLMDWEEYGLRIGVSKGSLPSSEAAEIAVVALVGGHFIFPRKMQLVSAIYAVSISKALDEPLRLDVQHCVNIRKPFQRNYLKFAIAPLNRPSVPYQFEVVEGGKFSVNSFYGSIHRQKFSLVGILAEDGVDQAQLSLVASDSTSSEEEFEQEDIGSTSGDDESTHSQIQKNISVSDTSSADEEEIKPIPVQLSLPKAMKSDGIDLSYVGMIFYEEKRVEYLATFTACKDLNALLNYIETRHPHAEIGQTVRFSFVSATDGYVEMIFDESLQDNPINGWTIQPHREPCKLLKKHIDEFGSDNKSPTPESCLISVYTTGIPNTVPVLHYGIPLEGVDPPVTVYIHRSMRTPTSTVAPSQLLPSSSGTQPAPSEVDVKQLIQVINGVLQSHFDDLIGLPEESLQALADQLFASNIISDPVRNNPAMDKFISEFNASLKWIKSQSDIQIHSSKFLNSFKSVGGSYSMAANVLHKDLIKAVNDKLNCDFCMDLKL